MFQSDVHIIVQSNWMDAKCCTSVTNNTKPSLPEHLKIENFSICFIKFTFASTVVVLRPLRILWLEKLLVSNRGVRCIFWTLAIRNYLL